MVPVSLRTEKDADGGGNMVGTILCNLATHLDDPAQRLDAIHSSMSDNKTVFSQLPQVQQFALSACLTGGLAFSAGAGVRRRRATAVQHRDLQRAGATGAAVLARRAASTATTRCRSPWTVRRSTSR